MWSLYEGPERADDIQVRTSTRICDGYTSLAETLYEGVGRAWAERPTPLSQACRLVWAGTQPRPAWAEGPRNEGGPGRGEGLEGWGKKKWKEY